MDKGYNDKSYGVVAYMPLKDILNKSHLYHSTYKMLKDVVDDKSPACDVAHPMCVKIELAKYKSYLVVDGLNKDILVLKDYMANEILGFKKNKFMILPDGCFVVNK